jgi:glycosyltransferase involved in cell wall biosynthesis
MKILYAYRYGIIGGVCTQLYNRALVLRELGCELSFYFSEDHGATKILAPFGEVTISKDVNTLSKLVKNGQFDHIIIIDTQEYFDVLLARDETADNLIAEVHTSIRRNLIYLNSISDRINKYITPSLYMKKMMNASFDIPSNQIHIASNCLQTDLFAQKDSLAQTDLPILLWVGKLDDHKGWAEFLEVLNLARESLPDFEAWMIGGSTAPEEIVQNLILTVDAMGLSDRVRWFDAVPYRIMPQFYSMASNSGGCNIVTSKNESFGMSVLEALLCGCPVISSDVGGISEFGKKKPYLRLYPYGPFEEVADLLIKTVDTKRNFAIREELDIDRDAIASKYSPQKVGAEYVDLLNRIS